MSLTPAQRQLYDFLLAFLLEHQRQPTVREVMCHFGLKSPNGVFCHFKPLTEKGWLTWEKNEESGQRRWKLAGIRLKAEPCESSTTNSSGTEAQDGVSGVASGVCGGNLTTSWPEGWERGLANSTFRST